MKRLVRAMTASLFAASIAGGALAQPAESVTSGAAETKAQARGETTEKEREKKGELELCKEKAQGLDGPERARFMTDCLRGPGRS